MADRVITPVDPCLLPGLTLDLASLYYMHQAVAMGKFGAVRRILVIPVADAIEVC